MNTEKEIKIPENSGETSSVFAVIVGKPNVGKSSLLNRLIGEKAAIVTPKPQTTRTRVTGIYTEGTVQYVFFDTPGFHTPHTRLGGRMAKTTRDSLADVDAVLMLFEPGGPIDEAELWLVEAIGASKLPAMGIVNKIDAAKSAEKLAARMAEVKGFDAFGEVLAVSAVTGEGCEAILPWLSRWALAGPHYFPDDAFTDTPEKQLVAEIVREKLLLFMRDEIPHGTAVEVERFKERAGDIIDIDVVIYCEKKSHKGMVIGKGGQMLKKIATAAREDSEALLGARVNMQCWVKVRDDWRNDENALNSLGFKR